MKFLLTCIFISGLMGMGGCIGEKNSFFAQPIKNSVHTSNLRLGGSYVGETTNSNNGTKGLKIFCLYQNGVALEYYFLAGTRQATNIPLGISYTDSLYKNVKQAGGFKINGSAIEIQLFEFVNYGKFEVCTYKGEILNDTTIRIRSCFMKSKSNFCPSTFDLKFTPMVKLDSTHQLMNKRWYWKD